jgi:hypothetical protein
VVEFLDLGAQPHCNRLVPMDRADIQEPRFPLRAGFCLNCTMVQIDYTIPNAVIPCFVALLGQVHRRRVEEGLAAGLAPRPAPVLQAYGPVPAEA